ncbi:uncharacterized protein LOC125206183 [Salvia hispanica]|uniref:uncharacterized protein LOC125206183 n=1 Tax=Salvia hispanica TaxID=49212 RepID=UPI002009CA74|nr:uncharacterized protein LOC125206183 [Salvia hispanica]
MWGDENVVVGFSSSSANSSQRNNIHSWSFESRIMPRWMHSEPLDPQQSVGKEEERKVHTVRIVSALAFGTGCGALGAMLVLILWAVLGDRRPIVPEELVSQSKESECKKFGVSVDKTVKDGKVLGA